jgi:hypothetical protein
MPNRSRIAFALVAIALMSVLGAGMAGATLYLLHAQADGPHETPANASPAVASADFTLDDVTYQLTWDITYGGLLAAPTASHVHSGAPGIPGPVIQGIGLPTGGHYFGSVITTLSVAAQMLGGGTYFNLHTQVYPGGEIRGQIAIVPVPVESPSWGAVKALYDAK